MRKSPQPFGFEPFSDIVLLRGTVLGPEEVAKAFRLRALFGLINEVMTGISLSGRQSLSASSPFRTSQEPRSPTRSERRQSLSASSPFRTGVGAPKKESPMQVAKAFRLRALFGLFRICRNIRNWNESPKPFGFEPFSDFRRVFRKRTYQRE